MKMSEKFIPNELGITAICNRKGFPERTHKYYRDIFSAINQICTTPEIGKSIQEVKPNHRLFSVKSHVIIYKIMSDQIFIDRILHQKMKLENFI